MVKYLPRPLTSSKNCSSSLSASPPTTPLQAEAQKLSAGNVCSSLVPTTSLAETWTPCSRVAGQLSMQMDQMSRILSETSWGWINLSEASWGWKTE